MQRPWCRGREAGKGRRLQWERDPTKGLVVGSVWSLKAGNVTLCVKRVFVDVIK